MKKRDKVPKDLQALERIKDLMFWRKVIPGQKLIYRDLEEALGMSKTPITNALVRLEQEGLVVCKKNRGYFVKELSENEIIQMYQMRIKLEEISIDFAIDNHDEEDLIEWRKYINRYADYDRRTYDSNRFQIDVDLHAYLAKMGKNMFLRELIRHFFLGTWAVLQTLPLSRRIDRFSEDHELLFQSVKSGNRAEAKRVIRNHHKAALEMALQGVKMPPIIS